MYNIKNNNYIVLTLCCVMFLSVCLIYLMYSIDHDTNYNVEIFMIFILNYVSNKWNTTGYIIEI